MARSKNTAETFEVLHRIARETEARRKADAGIPATQGTTRPPAPPTLQSTDLNREPLLKAPQASTERISRLGAAASRLAGDTARAGQRWLPPRAEAEPGLEGKPRRGGPDSILARLSRSAPTAATTGAEAPGLLSESVEEWTAQRERLALLGGTEEAWSPPARLGVDPVLVESSPLASSGDARRVRFLEAREPLPTRPASIPEPKPVPAAAAPQGGSSAGAPSIERRAGSRKSEKEPRGSGGRRGKRAGAPEVRDTSPGPTEPPAPSPDTTAETLPRAAGPEETAPELQARSRIGVELEEMCLASRETLEPTSSVTPTNDAAAPAVQAGEAASISVRARRALAWILGQGGSPVLEKRVELRVSTLLVFAMAGIVITTLVLTYLRMPGEEDPLYRSSFQGGPGARIESVGSGPRLPARAEESPGTAAQETVGPPAAPIPGFTRRLPIWSPGNPEQPVRPGEPLPRFPDPPAEVRNVESHAPPAEKTPQDDASVERSAHQQDAPRGDAAATPAPESTSPFTYRIQVRAKESMTGAQSIVEYLRIFGFDSHLIEEDLRGDRNTAGEKLYTVFVGSYSDENQAKGECQRLKAESRQRPYKSKPDFFGSSLVITRKR